MGRNDDLIQRKVGRITNRPRVVGIHGSHHHAEGSILCLRGFHELLHPTHLPDRGIVIPVAFETGNSMEVRDVKMRLASQTDPVAQVSEVVRNTLIISPGLAAIAVNTTGRRQQSGIELMSRRGALRRRA